MFVFQGSVFATFIAKDDVDKFIKEENTKFKDTEVEKKMTK